MLNLAWRQRSVKVAMATAVLVVSGALVPSVYASSGKTKGKTKLVVSTSPVSANASLYYPIMDGAYAKSGLSVEPKLLENGGTAVPLLLNGQLQFAASDSMSAMLAIAHHVPIEIVANAMVVPSSASDNEIACVVAGNSSISSLKDLDGKTVAVNQLGGFTQIGLAAAIDRAGGNSTSVKWVEVPIPAMNAAVANGTVDAAEEGEPFVTQAEHSGLKTLLNGGLQRVLGGTPPLVYIASVSYVKSHPSVVKAFVDNVNKASHQLARNPALIRKVSAKSTSVSGAALSEMALPRFGVDLSIAGLHKVENVMLRYGVLSAPVYNLKEFVYSG